MERREVLQQRNALHPEMPHISVGNRRVISHQLDQAGDGLHPLGYKCISEAAQRRFGKKQRENEYRYCQFQVLEFQFDTKCKVSRFT